MKTILVLFLLSISITYSDIDSTRSSIYLNVGIFEKLEAYSANVGVKHYECFGRLLFGLDFNFISLLSDNKVGKYEINRFRFINLLPFIGVKIIENQENNQLFYGYYSSGYGISKHNDNLFTIRSNKLGLSIRKDKIGVDFYILSFNSDAINAFTYNIGISLYKH